MHATRGELFAAVLPQEFSSRVVEANQATQVDGGRITLDIARAVVGPHVSFSVGDDRVSIRFRAEGRRPANVLASLHVECDWKWTRVRYVVALGRSTPLRPILGLDLQLGDPLSRYGCRIEFLLSLQTRREARQSQQSHPERVLGNRSSHASFHLDRDLEGALGCVQGLRFGCEF